ncbi:DUF2303 family protein [Nitrosomonas communis]|uniref:Uncharacterized conserved protein YfdQ, DUF2303 family n=1 Tax=Nitrosomonas communis TaxID=44574 RepID=A0A1I4RUZ0_9PROT|nr:DUF2303 family protein [Nitrosomonas communis]SFM55884.1 Uncharacterized conserved protein YfdQ, DUF2303 family [Nitrosomonas communis]
MEQNVITEVVNTIVAALQKPVEVISDMDDHDIKRVALPPGWILQERDDIKLKAIPQRKTGQVILNDAESFIDYINRHKLDNSTTLYCQTNYEKGDVNFIVVFNDHIGMATGQQWRDHLASFEPGKSIEWERWAKNDREVMTQREFALFIEDNLRDIATVEGMPTGQQLLEMALSFEANQDMRFKSAIRLQNGGVQMSFVQDDDSATLAKMQLFDKISIGIPVFWNGDAYRIDARLRYRARDSKLVFWYELIRPDKVIEDATKVLINTIKEKTEVFFYFGDPSL